MNNLKKLVNNNLNGILISILIGIFSYVLSTCIDSGLSDPLIMSLIVGIFAGLFFSKEKINRDGFHKIPFLFIPVGVIFYGFKNLNFSNALEINSLIILLLILVILSYCFVTIILGKILKQKKEITYLTATGSAICGASAITVIAPSIEADSDDVSISLLSVFVAGIFGLFVFLPFLAVFFDLTNEVYALLSGSVLQFTGFVKASVISMPPLRETMETDKILGYALSIKAFRYLGLLLAIPLFASLSRKKLIMPWYLWAFLSAGILGTYLSVNHQALFFNLLSPFIVPVYGVLWSISMAAIGINTNLSKLISNNGIKSLFMSFISFFIAIIIFLLGVKLILF